MIRSLLTASVLFQALPIEDAMAQGALTVTVEIVGDGISVDVDVEIDRTRAPSRPGPAGQVLRLRSSRPGLTSALPIPAPRTP